MSNIKTIMQRAKTMHVDDLIAKAEQCELFSITFLTIKGKPTLKRRKAKMIRFEFEDGTIAFVPYGVTSNPKFRVFPFHVRPRLGGDRAVA